MRLTATAAASTRQRLSALAGEPVVWAACREHDDCAPIDGFRCGEPMRVVQRAADLRMQVSAGAVRANAVHVSIGGAQLV